MRLFPDYADTVIWFAPGPVPYEETGISPELVADMEVWEQRYYDGLTDEFEWSSAAAEQLHAEDALRIATALTHELGDAFEVEVFGVGEDTIRMRGTGDGTNAAAVRAFRSIAQSAAEDEARFAETSGSGSSGWFAKRPPDA